MEVSDKIMAKVSYIHPVETLSGRLNKKEKNGTIQRCKRFRNAKGEVYASAKLESYVIKFPRDYHEHPMSDKERFNATTFRQAIIKAKEERENPERLAYWKQRFQDQLTHGDPQAPIRPGTAKRKIYKRLDMFIQSMIQIELRKQN